MVSPIMNHDVINKCSNCGYKGKGLTTNSKCPFCWNMVRNSDEDTERAFHKSIQENPLDATHRLIYGDWLEERGRDREAHLQRAIVNDPEMMRRISKHRPSRSSRRRRRSRTQRDYGGDWGGLSPEHRWQASRGGRDHYRRNATPREASIRARDISLGVGEPFFKIVNQSRAKARQAAEYGKARSSKEAIAAHHEAALLHIQAAKEIERRRKVPVSYLSELRRMLGHDNSYGIRNTGLDTDTSRIAAQSTIKANKDMSEQSHEEAGDLHHEAARIHEEHANRFRLQHNNNASGEENYHRGLADIHYDIGNYHQSLIPRSGTAHRIAAHGHMIAAEVHRRHLRGE